MPPSKLISRCLLPLAGSVLFLCGAQAFAEDNPLAEMIEIKRKAAEQGDAAAQLLIGGAYDNGDGVPKDAIKAAEWFRKAADQGFAKAQFLLGYVYRHGMGVPKDAILAYMWFNLSSAGGVEDAGESRDSIAVEMTPEQIAEAQRLSREWKPMKATAGH